MVKTLGIKDLLAEDFDPARMEALNFEHGMKLLEELVERVESGTLALEKTLLAYERGVALLARLRGELGKAEEKLREL
jgi:exodeoxyribonuclease VII small subunit